MFLFSALVIIEPLPEEIYLTPGEDLNMSIKINGSSKDDIIISLGHSSRGVYEDLTEHLVYEISKEEDGDEEDVDISMWKIDMILPYPFSQFSGDLTLNVGDKDSGDVTTTRLVVGQEGKDVSPFFDPVPKSQKAFTGQNVLINTKARGSAPITVSIKYKIIFLEMVKLFAKLPLKIYIPSLLFLINTDCLVKKGNLVKIFHCPFICPF